jgi:hypothetical protein
MESVYYSCRLKSLKRAPGVLDDYEEKLGFHAVFVEVAAAWEKNRKIQEKSDFAEIPWIERETKVLAVLKDARPTTP